MKAVWYERQGQARDVLVVGDMDDPEPGPGEVRIQVKASGINPGDLKKRQDAFGIGMPYPRVVPHSDGAGVIEKLGTGVPEHRLGERVWCYGAQSYRPHGTAAEFVVVPQTQAVWLPAPVSFEQGACLGIPGITAHRTVHAAGAIEGRTVLVQGAAGAVGSFARSVWRAGEEPASLQVCVRRSTLPWRDGQAPTKCCARTDGPSRRSRAPSKRSPPKAR